MKKAASANPATRKLVIRSLHGEIANIIRDRIAEGILPPGSFIDEAALALEFGISKTPIREVLKVLAADQMVDIFPNRGSFVARLTPRDAKELIAILAELEGFAAELACKNASDEDIRSLRRIHEAMRAAFAEENYERYFRLNQDFHAGVVQASGNLQLIDIHEGLTSRLRRLRYLSNLKTGGWTRSRDDHEELIQLLEARQAAALRRMLKRHVAGIWPDVADIIEAE